jgi:hypothetical protein
MFACQYSLEHTVTPSGRSLGFWMAGSVVFAATVIIANLKILESSHIHALPSITLIFLSIVSYYVIFVVMNLIPTESYLYGVFNITFDAPMTWLSLFFASMIVFTFDQFGKLVRIEIENFIENRKIRKNPIVEPSTEDYF